MPPARDRTISQNNTTPFAVVRNLVSKIFALYDGAFRKGHFFMSGRLPSLRLSTGRFCSVLALFLLTVCSTSFAQSYRYASGNPGYNSSGYNNSGHNNSASQNSYPVQNNQPALNSHQMNSNQLNSPQFQQVYQKPVVQPTQQYFSDPSAVAPFQANQPVRTQYQTPGHSTIGWGWTLLPSDIIYKSYLAGEKEARIKGVWLHEKGRGWLWDIALGGRAGIIRYGSKGVTPPSGIQLDIEAVAFPRLDFEHHRDLEASDFRFGIPLTWSRGPYEAKFAYYHISDHIGDEFLERVPGSVRRNYSRDSMVLGGGYYPHDDIRLYAEIEYGFFVYGGAEPWAIQFGAEYSPIARNGIFGTPFAALNIHLREELDWNGSVNSQLGWQWRSEENNHIFRMGLQARSGATNQYTFLGNNEQQFGFGLWYDF